MIKDQSIAFAHIDRSRVRVHDSAGFKKDLFEEKVFIMYFVEFRAQSYNFVYRDGQTHLFPLYIEKGYIKLTVTGGID
jgi:hypothetical protein